ncbi:HAD family hydrolase [Paracidovorax anthurii]|uniref:Putative hydrolase of the HAD superfamily n=1 Tax=Paracidovorax anthurii TaxID=78229 RepID=A0A328ZJ68_9BURK|nr:HAD family hydrolase [Paracidovorax anthurii]RAR86238.1 putative hydrolase of the HAD superfamily [Paracidovorax anthurii]
MLDTARIRAITLDLDDTLWPIWPTIGRAEQVLRAWLTPRAPATAALLADAGAAAEIRAEVVQAHAHLGHDLSALRRESIRAALRRAGDDESLTDAAFDLFFAERQRVELYDDAIAALEFLAMRHPLLALTNGNANLGLIGIDRYFQGSVTAREFGVAKPDPRIFHEAAGRLGVAPEAVLHVGDDATLDACGARQAGMQAVWINRGGAAWPHGGEAPATVEDLTGLCRLLAPALGAAHQRSGELPGGSERLS